MSHSSAPEVVVVGAGAAGIGAAMHLRTQGVEVLVLEAKDRIGGRAHTLTGAQAALDMGCGWLHSADQNPLTALVEPAGLTLDRSEPAWTKPAIQINFPMNDQRAYAEAFQAFEDAMEKAAKEPVDIPASDLFGVVDPKWIPLLNAFSGYYNGASFERISVKDYAAYEPTDENWRVREGYGTLIATLGQRLKVRLSTPVERIAHGGAAVTVSGPWGSLEAGAVIVAVSTGVLAGEAIAFDPPLPDKIEAAHNLPLGHVEKAFLSLSEAEFFPVETMVRGRIDAATGGYTLRPMGLPIIEGFFGWELAASLEMEAEDAFTAFAIEELVAVFGSDFRRKVTPLGQSGWRGDPFIRGAYSHARVGQAAARAVLAAPVGERLFFAGEACSPHAFSTAHGAYETGIVAAEAALATLRRR